MASPRHGHQSSLEGSISFSSNPPLEHEKHVLARDRFYEVLEHCEDVALPNQPYSRTKLLRLTYDYSPTNDSKISVLRAFFHALGVSIEDPDSLDIRAQDTESNVVAKLVGFADSLINNFFLPLKASTKRTPQPSPAHHSADQQTRPGKQTFVGTSARLNALRGDCLVRDRHRCVISRRFDQAQAVKRMQEKPGDARDDDDNPLIGAFDKLEVAHILPHSLTKSDPGRELDPSRAAALKMLNMFDTDVACLIDGPEIDRARNALTLTSSLHSFFSDFQIFFEAVDDSADTYKIDTFLPRAAFDSLLPVVRTLFVTDERTIDPPSPRLLAVHRAIAHILHLSAAGAYIDKILEDASEATVRVDGSTAIGDLVQLRLDGWWDGRVEGQY